MHEELMKKLIEYVESTKDFVFSQSPEIIQQILFYEKMESILSIIVSFLLMCFVSFIGLYFYKHAKIDKYDHMDFLSFMVPWLSFVFLFILGGVLFSSILKLMKISYSPKYYLISLLMNYKN